MKTKQEQIEELSTQISHSCERHDLGLHEPEIDLIAIDVYNAGYRKSFINAIEQVYRDGYEKGVELCGQSWDSGYDDGYESGKEDGAKEFAKKLKDKLQDIDELLKEYTE